MTAQLPKFAELPLRKDDPPWSAWGLYGPHDELGTLNRLTDDVVLQAAQEIKLGQRVSLNWALDAQGDVVFFGRQAFSKNVYNRPPRCVNDDTWTFNTQSSSQCKLDQAGMGFVTLAVEFRQFANMLPPDQKERKFYNGVTLDDIFGENKTNVNGIHAWSEKGIVGRGILLDYDSWRKDKNIQHNVFESDSIKLEHLLEVARDQGTEIKFGDILIIRSGYMEAAKKLDWEELRALSQVSPPSFAGVEQSEEMLEWIWNNFSAVAGDHPAFESYPSKKDFSLHEVLLAGWGCPIGELFDLEALAKKCKELGRWSFFCTSEVCNVPGAVASPPNILAIF